MKNLQNQPTYICGEVVKLVRVESRGLPVGSRIVVVTDPEAELPETSGDVPTIFIRPIEKAPAS